jgi:hypothetical protein
MENRAAVFTSDPQTVEVYQSGAWWPGELLGWRHDISGSCQVWVRVVLGGVEESDWTDLTSLRLPESQVAVGAEGSPAGARSLRLSAQRQVGAFGPSEIAILPLIRDLSEAPTRRTGAAASGGRRRAPESAPSAPAPAVRAAARGRHRAPADPGRHRASDTGLLPAVAAVAAVAADAHEAVTAQRPAVGAGPRSIRSTGGAPQVSEPLAAASPTYRSAVDPEPELLTRPMRLSDLGPRGRRPRLDGFLASV